MTKALRWLVVTLIGLGVVAAIVYALAPRPLPVEVATAMVGSLEATVDEEGRTRIRERYVVSSPLIGRLRRIELDPGDPVAANETVLAVIEPTDPDLLDARALAEAEARVRAEEAAVRKAGAAVERARAAFELAEQELARFIDASERDAANIRELDQTRTERRQAAEDLRSAEFGREIAEYELEAARSALLYARGETEGSDRARMSIVSPIDGVVLRVLRESMSIVEPGAALIEVGDPRDLEIVVDVLSTDAVRIRPGQRVVIEHWGGPAPLEAVVRRVEPSAFTKVSALGVEEQRVNVIADFITPADERTTLGDGFRVEARIVVWAADEVLQIPGSAAFRFGDGWAVFVLADGDARRRAVEIGQRGAGVVEVRSGLEPGDRVVRHPTDELVDGASVAERKGAETDA